MGLSASALQQDRSPSMLAHDHKVGARIWIARIMITWGAISVAMMFVTTPTMFYVLRFLLGVAEAGFFPGIILYLDARAWIPAATPQCQRQAGMVGIASLDLR